MRKEDIASGLGASVAWEFSGDNVIFKFFDRGKIIGMRRARLIKKPEKDLKKLGKAYGINIQHCFYLAKKYCKDFTERVCAYKIGPGKECYVMSVTFYRRKKSKLR